MKIVKIDVKRNV